MSPARTGAAGLRAGARLGPCEVPALIGSGGMGRGPWTGRRELWKEMHDQRTGGAVSNILFSADGKACVWTHWRYSSALVLVEGLK